MMIEESNLDRRALIKDLCGVEARRNRLEPNDLESEVYLRIWEFVNASLGNESVKEQWRSHVRRTAQALRKREQRARRKGPPAAATTWERVASAFDQPEYVAQFNEGIEAIRSNAGPIDLCLLDSLFGRGLCCKQKDIAVELGISPKTVSKHKVQLEKRLRESTGAQRNA